MARNKNQKNKHYFRREGLSFYKSTFLLIIFVLQVALFVGSFVYFAEKTLWIYVVSIVLAILTSLRILIKPKNSAAKISWIMLVLIFPSFGFLIYFLAGGSDLHPRHKRDIQIISDHTDSLLPKNDFSSLTGSEKENSKFLASVTNASAYDALDTEYYPMGEDALKAVIEEIKKAKKSIYLEFFIVSRGDIFSEVINILVEKANQGVDVRFIYDGFGGKTFMTLKLRKFLKKSKIKVASFTPISLIFTFYMNYRDHRKFVIIDNNVCFTGGFNLADEYANIIERFGVWKDSGIKFVGPAVNYFTVEFLKMWTFVTKERDAFANLELHPSTVVNNINGILLPYVTGPNQPTSVGRSMYVNLISAARSSINIMTPYLIIDDSIFDLLKTKAASGVEVNIFIPGIPDKKIVYSLSKENALILASLGCNVYIYKPGFLHSKNILIDDKEAIVGSINFDYRSFYQLYEDAVYFTNPKLISGIVEDFRSTREECEKIDPSKLKKKSMFYRIYVVLLRWLSPLM